jgi:hypothetical protein
MANINSTDYIYKYGKLVQFGTDFMVGFSSFADEFNNTLNLHIQEIADYGYSTEWNNWQKQNAEAIIQLHDELEEAKLLLVLQ